MRVGPPLSGGSQPQQVVAYVSHAPDGDSRKLALFLQEHLLRDESPWRIITSNDCTWNRALAGVAAARHFVYIVNEEYVNAVRGPQSTQNVRELRFALSCGKPLLPIRCMSLGAVADDRTLDARLRLAFHPRWQPLRHELGNAPVHQFVSAIAARLGLVAPLRAPKTAWPPLGIPGLQDAASRAGQPRTEPARKDAPVCIKPSDALTPPTLHAKLSLQRNQGCISSWLRDESLGMFRKALAAGGLQRRADVLGMRASHQLRAAGMRPAQVQRFHARKHRLPGCGVWLLTSNGCTAAAQSSVPAAQAEDAPAPAGGRSSATDSEPGSSPASMLLALSASGTLLRSLPVHAPASSCLLSASPSGHAWLLLRSPPDRPVTGSGAATASGKLVKLSMDREQQSTISAGWLGEVSMCCCTPDGGLWLLRAAAGSHPRRSFLYHVSAGGNVCTPAAIEPLPTVQQMVPWYDNGLLLLTGREPAQAASVLADAMQTSAAPGPQQQLWYVAPNGAGCVNLPLPGGSAFGCAAETVQAMAPGTEDGIWLLTRAAQGGEGKRVRLHWLDAMRDSGALEVDLGEVLTGQEQVRLMAAAADNGVWILTGPAAAPFGGCAAASAPGGGGTAAEKAWAAEGGLEEAAADGDGETLAVDSATAAGDAGAAPEDTSGGARELSEGAGTVPEAPGVPEPTAGPARLLRVEVLRGGKQGLHLPQRQEWQEAAAPKLVCSYSCGGGAAAQVLEWAAGLHAATLRDAEHMTSSPHGLWLAGRTTVQFVPNALTFGESAVRASTVTTRSPIRLAAAPPAL